MKQWISQHRQAFDLVLTRMWQTKLATLMMVSVIGVTMSLPAGLYVLLDNVGKLAGGLESNPQISLFLAIDASQESIKELNKKLRSNAQIKDFHFVGRDTAWAELKQKSGLEDISAGLEKNPLPDAYIIRTLSTDPSAVDQLKQELQQLSGVEHVQLDAAWVQRLHSLIQIGHQAVVLLSGLLGFALLAVVGNTIRLQILTQREEIEVSQLIGATDAFIRRPFLYAGTLHGLGGGIAAWVFIYAAILLFNLSIQDLARLYATDFHLQIFDSQTTALMLVVSAFLGWAGSYLAVSRYLTAIKPS